MLQVYLDPCTINSRKVLAGLDLIGLKYNLNHVDYFKGEQKGPEYMKINPMATVPAAVDGGCVITESNAILQYGADLWAAENNKASPLYPADLKQRAQVNKWLLWEACAWFPSCYIYVVENIVKPLLKAQPDQAVLSKEEPNWHKLAGILDAQLAKTKFLAGDHVTIADVAVAAPMHLNKGCKFPLNQHQNLSRWLQDIEQLPEWKKTQPPVDKLLG